MDYKNQLLQNSIYYDIFKKSRTIQILIHNKTGHIIDANLAAKEFYGYPIEQLKEMKISQIHVTPEDEFRMETQTAKKEKRNYLYLKHKLSSGEIRDVEVHSSPIRTKQGVLLFSVVFDVFQLKRFQKRREEFLERIKTEYINNLNHEIRTPLNVILGFTELLSNYTHEPQYSDDLNSIRIATRDLLQILTNLFELSQDEIKNKPKRNISKKIYFEKATVLVVDDNDLNRKLIPKFRTEGLTVLKKLNNFIFKNIN